MKQIKSCYLCGSKNYKERAGKVRDNNCLKVLECSFCGLVFLSSFSHYNENFYENSNMHESDYNINEWLKKTERDDVRRFKFLEQKIENKNILDFGCGNGGFILKAKKKASFCAAVELETRAKEFLEKQDIKITSSIEKMESGKFDLITLFHVLEHLPNPISVLKNISGKLSENGEIIIESPNSNDALLSLYHSKYFSEFTYWSCHLYIFNEFTLKLIAEKCKFKVNFIKQIQRYPISNHLYWLSYGKPGGHNKFHFLDSKILNDVYESSLASIGCCDTIIASFSNAPMVV